MTTTTTTTTTSGSDTDKSGGRRRRECMNSSCGISPAGASWRKGWPLRSGGFADLCDKCGSAYEQSIFCEVFHTNDSGWRKCFTCGKNLHCGCAASRPLVELLDCGGVSCTSCCRNLSDNQVNGDERPSGLVTLRTDETHSVAVVNQLDAEDKLTLARTSTEGTSTRNLLHLDNDKANGFPRQTKQEDDNLPSAADIYEATASAAKDLYESMAQASLSTNPGLLLGSLNTFPGVVVNERPQFQSKASSPVQQGSRSRHLLPKPPKSGLAIGLEPNGGMFASQVRVARPPAEGRGRNQLLPRYWPRITDQELQQLSGDSNSTIVPLFEKVLSASDAGRIGRLVLPKACAEAYFPPISQPEGLPLRIQDVKGKEWVFQFRFWPNNNSRMYVLEGVTPCIQSMQLQAGDTVTFSRMDPEGKLVMGFRKASIANNIQDSQPAGFSNGNHPSDRLFSGVFDNLPIISGYSGLLHSLKGSSDTQLSAISKSLHPEGSWQKVEKQEIDAKEGLLPQSLLLPERKRSRNIGSKSKRLLFDGLDALELKLTWEEAQELLCPPPTVKPSIVTIEDHDFEEYDEPPVFGKKSIFVARSTGGQEQWAQCDSCAKWRRLPVDVLLPPKWTCQDNSWDQTRCSCSAPDELTPREMESLLRLNMDFKRRKLASVKQVQEQESSGLDTLATAAILGDIGGPSTTVVAATTKHPRHRPGCSCIVCIQPPSGKGKHKPSCTCNVCMTVKRRFKTMMMRKKKRQSEREAEIAQRNQHTWGPKEEVEVENSSKHASSPLHTSDSNGQKNNPVNKLVDTNKGNIDLNFHPDQDPPAGLTRLSMMSLLHVASRPLDTYLKQNGLAGLVTTEQASSASNLQPQAGENDDDEQLREDSQTPSHAVERESGGEENDASLPDDSQNEPI